MDKSGQYREIKDFNIDRFFEILSEQALSTVFVRQGEVEELANKKGAVVTMSFKKCFLTA